jgi:MFS family permease
MSWTWETETGYFAWVIAGFRQDPGSCSFRRFLTCTDSYNQTFTPPGEALPAMIRSNRPAEFSPPIARAGRIELSEAGITEVIASDRGLLSSIPEQELKAYGTAFWFAYGSNILLMLAVSLLFRFSDFVSVLGGSERDLGLIVGVGMVGSLIMRLAQGKAIDRYGARAVWVIAMALVAITLGLHLLVQHVHGPGVYVLQIVYRASLSGVYGASITYVSLRAPVSRMAEVVGVLGSSGFIGMALGTQLGDYLCREQRLARTHLDVLFLTATGLAFLSLVLAWVSTRGVVRPIHRSQPPMLWLIRRYHPGTMLLMSFAMGVAVALPFTFLRPFTVELGMKTIGTFFACYTATAFITRVSLRRISERIGVRNTVLAGMAMMIVGILLYLPVQVSWQLAFPGIVAGAAHALLFPAIVAGGGTAFPTRYRGLGVTLTLGLFDMGALIGAPLAGSIVEAARKIGWSPYPTMYLTMASLMALLTVVFALTYRARPAGMRRPRKLASKT